VGADKKGDASTKSFASLDCAGRNALSDSWTAEALANSLEAQSQPVNDPSSPAVTEVVNEVMRQNEYAHVSEPKLTSSSEVQEAIKGLEVGQVLCPNGAPK
jgi:hypothetical protein